MQTRIAKTPAMRPLNVGLPPAFLCRLPDRIVLDLVGFSIELGGDVLEQRGVDLAAGAFR